MKEIKGENPITTKLSLIQVNDKGKELLRIDANTSAIYLKGKEISQQKFIELLNQQELKEIKEEVEKEMLTYPIRISHVGTDSKEIRRRVLEIIDKRLW